ncbi:MAG: hypothetical protein IIB02_08780, partial [Thaumarchaeota archaeon]|nr:hypothetical protein [Nitrososphaerota archaeon]
MVKKRDSIIDEAEKIKADLDKLKKNKKILDSTLTVKTKKPEAKSTKKPEAKSTKKPEAKSTKKPEAKSTKKPEAKSTKKPEAKSTK